MLINKDKRCEMSEDDVIFNDYFIDIINLIQKVL